MGGWAKIEIEFQPERHDPNEVMLFLLEHFRDDNGVPTANVLLVGAGMEQEIEDGIWPFRNQPPTDPEKGADAIWAAFKTTSPYGSSEKIKAIKEMRVAYNIGLREAKDYIDRANMRNP